MQRSELRPLGGAVPGMGFLTQAQPGRPLGIPMWVWILLFVVIIVVAIIWVLREGKEEAAPEKEEAEAPSEPAAELEPEVATQPAAAAVAVELEAGEEPAEADDLQRIEGIGPKIAGLLQDAGITSFAQLADTDVERLQGILDEAGISHIADPSSWPEQARLAAAGNWTALEALQDRLKGGRQVKPDNFQRIEGIGPKIAGVLVSAGITSFAQLAEADVGRLQGILDEAGISRMADPSTWPEQAKLAADGDWTRLEALQAHLKGGRRTEA